jgi:type IV secretion system protein VirB1
MENATLLALLLACAPQVDATTARALVQVESAANPYAIGVVGGALRRQPTNRTEAIATAKALQTAGWNFSVGLAQINLRNFERLGLTVESAFEPCANLQAMQAVLGECFARASAQTASPGHAVRNALSCYSSGNFTTGFRQGYVRKVALAAAQGQTALGTATPVSSTNQERS